MEVKNLKEEIDKIEEEINQNKLNHVIVKNCSIIDERLLKAIRNSKTFHTLDISSNFLHNEVIELVADIIKNNENFIELNVNHCYIGFDRLKVLVEAIQLNKNFKCLNISNNNIGDKGILEISKITNINFDTLNVGSNKISILPDKPFKVLDISCNQIHKNLHEYEDYLSQCESLTMIGCNIKTKEAKIIANIIKKSKLKHLNISSNDIPYEGFKEIMNAIELCETFEHLNASDNMHFDVNCLKEISCKNKFDSLDLYNNKINDEGAKIILSFIKNLKHLNISSNYILYRREDILKAIGDSKKLETFYMTNDYYSNLIHYNEIEIAYAIENNKNLKILHIDKMNVYNEIDIIHNAIFKTKLLHTFNIIKNNEIINKLNRNKNYVLNVLPYIDIEKHYLNIWLSKSSVKISYVVREEFFNFFEKIDFYKYS